MNVDADEPVYWRELAREFAQAVVEAAAKQKAVTSSNSLRFDQLSHLASSDDQDVSEVALHDLFLEFPGRR